MREGASLQRDLAAAREATQQLAAVKDAEVARLAQVIPSQTGLGMVSVVRHGARGSIKQLRKNEAAVS